MIRLLLFCLGIVLVAADASVAQTFDPEVYYQIRPRHTGKCLDVVGVSALNGAQLQQWDCNAGAQANQLWTVQPTGSGAYRVVSAVSAKCVDVPFGSPDNGQLAQQWDCNLAQSQANQVFVISGAPTAGYYRLWGAHSPSGAPKCLDVQNASPANGALVQQWDCGPWWNDNQDWAFVPAAPRAPRTHIKVFGYYGEMPNSVAIGLKNHVNNVVFTMPYLSNMAALAPHGIKGKVVLADLFRIAPKSGGDIYSDCDPDPSVACSDGGLLRNYASKWAEMEAQIRPSESSVEMFYLLDEPYWNLHFYNGFTKAEIYQMLEHAANLVKADFGSIPIAVVEAWPMVMSQGGVSYPSAINWVGFDCYGPIATCGDGTPYMTIYNTLKASLSAEQRMIILPHGSVDREPNPNGETTTIAPSTLATSSAEQSELVGRANFYISLALSEPRAIAVLVWHGPSRLKYYAPGHLSDGLIIGTLDMAAVKTKWTFLARAIGFGTP